MKTKRFGTTNTTMQASGQACALLILGPCLLFFGCHQKVVSPLKVELATKKFNEAVRSGTDLRSDLVILNRSNSPVDFIEMQRSCTCGELLDSKEKRWEPPQVILPGEEVKLIYQISTKNKLGRSRVAGLLRFRCRTSQQVFQEMISAEIGVVPAFTTVPSRIQFSESNLKARVLIGDDVSVARTGVLVSSNEFFSCDLVEPTADDQVRAEELLGPSWRVWYALVMTVRPTQEYPPFTTQKLAIFSEELGERAVITCSFKRRDRISTKPAIVRLQLDSRKLLVSRPVFTVVGLNSEEEVKLVDQSGFSCARISKDDTVSRSYRLGHQGPVSESLSSIQFVIVGPESEQAFDLPIRIFSLEKDP